MLSLPSTSSSISRKKYDVFLSFRGEDTRKNFTDHLYHALKRSGIITFKDDPKLEAGEEIAPDLFKAIQQSWCSVIVFSESYASSGWCLDELSEIVKQKNDKGYKVFPVFYDVDPSDLRKQKGKVEEAFAEHKKRYDEDKLQRWRNALTQVANIKGWHLNHRRDWFGLGSRIIVTTRDEHLLRSYRVDDVYKPTTLNDNDALRLFNFKAFSCEKVPKEDFIELVQHVVGYAGGLPLALEVLGSFLCDRDASQWRSAIERLKRDSNKEILDRLQISFDGLEETEKNIFLDIACFFNGEEKDFVMKVLDGCEFFPDIGIDVLIKKSLLTVNKYNQLRMHDLLQEMGRKIVREKSIDELEKRCRLWEERDVYNVLITNAGTEMIKGIIIDNKREMNKTLSLSEDAFLKMKRLRLLRVISHSICRDLVYLSNELRLLDWTGYPLKSLPSSFQPENLVAVLLSYSNIEQP
ncbi:hypothetical protein V6Z12_A11G329800 [Gossypium hirsutum]